MNWKIEIHQLNKKVEELQLELSRYRVEELKPLSKSLDEFIGKEVYFKNELLGFDAWDKECVNECNDTVKSLEKLPKGIKITFNNGKHNLIRLKDKYTIFTV